MDEKIHVLMTIPLAEDVAARINSLSPRLSVNVARVSQADEIPKDIWAAAEILYTAWVIPKADQAPNLRWIQFHFTGIDHAVNQPILQREDVQATTMSGASATQMAEYILLMLLALGHRLPDLFENQRKSAWPKDRWERFASVELRQATVGIVGYGSIGRQVARLVHGFGAKILAAKRDLKHLEDGGYAPLGFGDPAGDYVHRFYPAEALASMAKDCDFLVVAVPLTSDTRNLINARIFDAMKESAYIIDASRGGVIHQASLITALEKNKIAGAALDVFSEEPLPPDNPLWKMPNVLLTPHIAGESRHYDERALQLFIENLSRYLAKEPLLNRVDVRRGY